MSNLLDKLKKSRQSNVNAGGHTFTIRRLNDFDIGEIMQDGGKVNPRTLLRTCVVDWPGMTELKLGIPGGTDIPVPFDPLLFSEWVAEQKDVWQPLSKLIWKQYNEHGISQDEAAGEPQAGLSQAPSLPASQA